MCSQNGTPCKKDCSDGLCGRIPEISATGLYIELKGGSTWFRPADRKEVFEVLDMIGEKSYRLVAGNTGHGKDNHI